MVRRLGRHLRARARRRGGLTPSDFPLASLTQRDVDLLAQRYRIADVLPLTPLQQGLLYHTGNTQTSDDLYAVQLDITVSGALDPQRLRKAVQTVINRHPHIVARFCGDFGQPVQVIPADPELAWLYAELSPAEGHIEEQVQRLCAAERAAVCGIASQPPFRAALIRTADNLYRFVLTNHHIVLDGWSKPILLRNLRQLLRRAAACRPSYRSFVTWLSERDRGAAQAAWREVLDGFDTPSLVGPRGAQRSVRAVWRRSRCLRRPQRRWASWRARAAPRSAPSCRPRGRNC